MSEAQKRVVITGPTGLIGRALIRQCVRSHTEVYAVVRPGSRRMSTLPEHPLVHKLECDLSDLGSLPGRGSGRMSLSLTGWSFSRSLAWLCLLLTTKLGNFSIWAQPMAAWRSVAFRLYPKWEYTYLWS